VSPPGQRGAPGRRTEGNPCDALTSDLSTIPQAADCGSRECVWCGAPTGSWLAICRRCAVAVREGNARRRDAARRLQPLASGRRDPIGARSDAPQGWVS
jgi:hypothetical protein